MACPRDPASEQLNDYKRKFKVRFLSIYLSLFHIYVTYRIITVVLNPRHVM